MCSTPDTTTNDDGIDANLYSRQIGTFGIETMGKLVKLRILICGLSGAGVETAKNIILAGPKEVMLYDDKPCEMRDLASNFFATEEDVAKGLSRSDAVHLKLAELNDNVKVMKLTGPIDSIDLTGLDVIVASEMSLSDMIKLNDRARQAGAGFIAYHTPGLACSVFVDFGDKFAVSDPDGEQPRRAIIEGITQYEHGVVQLYSESDKRTGFSVGDYVRFREVKGMTEINAQVHQITAVTGNSTIQVGDTRSYSPYERDGFIEQVKVPQPCPFTSLASALQHPLPPNKSLITPDFAKFGRSEQLFYAFKGLWECLEKKGTADPDSVVEMAKTALKTCKGLEPKNGWSIIEVDEVDEDIAKKLAAHHECRLSPVAAFVGGVVAQEIVKYTGKFTPIHQWLFLDFFEALPPTKPTDCQRCNCRYDDQIAIWGQAFQHRLAKQKLFVVGAGALGCEYLKSLALMGCGTEGSVTVTDMDRIEISNLNRQFLFRRCHVGQSKSSVAAAAAKKINPNIKITAYDLRVGPETEAKGFTDSFFASLDCVINALDNIPSRLYIDGRCVWWGRPLLESGTLGTKANSQVIIPKRTECYGDSRDPPEDSIPLCTLRHFPNEISHTIEWARDAFEGTFCDVPQSLVAFIQSPDTQIKVMLSEGTITSQLLALQDVAAMLKFSASKPTFESCVQKAIDLFQNYFNELPNDLLASFPLDHVTSSGAPFWSGPKRAPTPISFTSSDPLHLSFVHSAANLFAFNYGLQQNRDIEVTKAYADKCKVPAYTPASRKQPLLNLTEDGEESNNHNSSGPPDPAQESSIKQCIEELKQLREQILKLPIKDKLTAAEFEKDDDTNFHIDYIHAAANLRARVYNIAECDRQNTLMIAGKIVPAIATTTAMITGLVSMEFLKLIDKDERKLEDFKNAYVNLALPLFVLTEPAEPVRTKSKEYDTVTHGPVRAKPEGFSTWDFIDMLNLPLSITLKQLVQRIETEQNVSVAILAVENSCLYNSFMPSHKNRQDRPVVELIKQVTKTESIPPNKMFPVECSASDADDDVDVAMPTIRLSFAESQESSL